MLTDPSLIDPSLTPLQQLLLTTLALRTGFLTARQVDLLACSMRPEEPVRDVHGWTKFQKKLAKDALKKLERQGLVELRRIAPPPIFAYSRQPGRPERWWGDRDRRNFEEECLYKDRDEVLRLRNISHEYLFDLDTLGDGARSVYYLWRQDKQRLHQEEFKQPPLGWPSRWNLTVPSIDAFFPTEDLQTKLRESLPPLPVWEVDVADHYARFCPAAAPRRENKYAGPACFSAYNPLDQPRDHYATHHYNLSSIYFTFLERSQRAGRGAPAEKHPRAVDPVVDPMGDGFAQFMGLPPEDVAGRWVKTACPRPAEFLKPPFEYLTRREPGRFDPFGMPCPYRALGEHWTLMFPDAYLLDDQGRPKTAVAFSLVYNQELHRGFHDFCESHGLNYWLY